MYYYMYVMSRPFLLVESTNSVIYDGTIITPHTCARGKVICLYVCRCCCRRCWHKIARSRDLDVCVCWKPNELADICEKLVSVCFELLNMAHKRYKSCIFHSVCLWFTDRTHSDLLHVFSAHAQRVQNR